MKCDLKSKIFKILLLIKINKKEKNVTKNIVNLKNKCEDWGEAGEKNVASNLEEHSLT